MNQRLLYKTQGNGRFWFFILLILLLAFALRLHHLTADAPLGISPTPELSLDGPATIAAGRDMALFGEWDAFSGPRQTQIMYPFINWLAFLFFRLLGVSYWSANFISVITSVLSIALVAGFARQHFGRRAALFSAFLLAINYVYIIYNRDPMAYTTVACGMVFMLYAWGRGLRQPVWFFISGASTAFAALFIKLPAISFLPAALLAFLWLIGQKRAWRNGRAYIPLLLFISGILLVIAAWVLFLYQPQPETVGKAYYARVVNPLQGLEQSIRAALWSVLYMGVDFGFVWRMLPLFILAYGYTFGRLMQLLSRKRPSPNVAEILLLTFLFSSLAMLYVSLIRPLRFQIILIPLISLTAGIALDRLLRHRPLALPTQFGRIYPLFLYGGVTYFLYQVIMAVHAFIYLQPAQSGFAQRWYMPEVPTAYFILTVSLVVAMPLVLFYLFMATQNQNFHLWPESRRYRSILVGGFLLSALLLQLFQYATMQQTIQYSTVEAARQIARDLPAETTILAGPFAPTLALENSLPAIWLLGVDERTFLDVEFTHLVVDVTGPYPPRYYTEIQLRDTVPELFTNAQLVHTYKVRDYTVHVYEMK